MRRVGFFALAVFGAPLALFAGSVASIAWTPAQLAAGESAEFAASGPDGNAWATEQQKGQVLKIAADGSVTRFPLPTGVTPGPIASGPDGNLWFTAVQGSGGSGVSVLGRMTTAGALTLFPYPNPSAFLGTPVSAPIVGSSDGFVYAADAPAAKIGKVTPATGAVTEIPVGHAPGDLAALPDGSLVIAEPNSGHFAARLVNGVVTQVNIPGGVIPSGVSPCIFGGAGGFCVADSHGFQSNFLVECTLAGACTSYPIDAHQCSAQRIACLGADCFLATPFCQEVVHADTTAAPPTSNVLAFPSGFNATNIRVLQAAPVSPATLEREVGQAGAKPQLVATGQNSGSGDFLTLVGLIPSADLGVKIRTDGRRGDGDFDLVVTNGGPDAAQSVELSIEPKIEVTFLSSSDPAVSCNSSTLVCTRSSLDAAASFTVMVNFSAILAPCTGTVSSATPDPDSENNTDERIPLLMYFPDPKPSTPPNGRGPK